MITITAQKAIAMDHQPQCSITVTFSIRLKVYSFHFHSFLVTFINDLKALMLGSEKCFIDDELICVVWYLVPNEEMNNLLHYYYIRIFGFYNL